MSRDIESASSQTLSPAPVASDWVPDSNFFDAPKPPPRRKRETPAPGADLCAANPGIKEVLCVETGEHLAVQSVIGTDYAELMKLRMLVLTEMQKEQPLYRCSLCATPVYLCSLPDRTGFFFRHRHEDGNCPAITRGRLSQDEIDARKYNGAKESRLHIKMKEWLVECLRVDGQFDDIASEARWSGPLTAEWRRPDVRATYNGLPIAFEVQLSTTHLNVIAGRREFYLNRGGLLFWIFATFDSEHGRLTEDDVFYNNNQNIFVVNANTLQHSIAAKEFVLECVWAEPTLTGGTTALRRKTVSFHELTLDQKSQRGYFFDFDGRKRALQEEAADERKLLRDDFDAWVGGITRNQETFHYDWSRFLRRFHKCGVAVPLQTGYGYFSDVVTTLYSAKHGKPWGQGRKKLVEVAHIVANRKNLLMWFMHAVRIYGREKSMQAEGDPRKWADKYQLCKTQYRQTPELFRPPQDLQPIVEFLFPELCPFPAPPQPK